VKIRNLRGKIDTFFTPLPPSKNFSMLKKILLARAKNFLIKNLFSVIYVNKMLQDFDEYENGLISECFENHKDCKYFGKCKLDKEIYNTVHGFINCNQLECYYDYYFQFRFGIKHTNYFMIILYQRIFMLNEICYLMSSPYDIFPYELIQYIYCYYLKLIECNWIRIVKNNIYDYKILCDKSLSNIIYYSDYEKNNLFKKKFQHCNGGLCHCTYFLYHAHDHGSSCETCNNFYCLKCQDEIKNYEGFDVFLCNECYGL
jgi:hypothetical protein